MNSGASLLRTCTQVLLFISPSFLWPQQIFATVFTVSNSEEFQAALSAAADNGGDDRIELSEGVFTGNFRMLSEEAQVIEIVGQGPARTILDGGLRAFVLELNMNSKRNSEVRVSGLSIENGYADGAGAGLSILAGNGYLGEDILHVAIDNVSFKENQISTSTAYGAALVVKDAFIELSDFEMLANRGGSTFWCEGCISLIRRGRFLENDVSKEVLHNGLVGKLELEEVEIDFRPSSLGNTAIDYGSSKCCESTSLPRDGDFKEFIIQRSRIKVRAKESLLSARDVRSAVIRGNRIEWKIDAGQYLGGSSQLGIVIDGGGTDTTITVENNHFLQEAQACLRKSPGARVLQVEGSGNGSVVLLSNLFQDNWETNSCSFLQPIMTLSRFTDTLVANNTFITGYEKDLSENTRLLSYEAADNGSESTLTFANNAIQHQKSEDGVPRLFSIGSRPLKSVFANNIYSGEIGYWDQESENIEGNPLFFDPEGGDFHLGAESVGINQGSNNYVSSTSALDLDGNPRVLDGTVDIGAYERSTADLHPADANGDGAISQAEFEEYNYAWRFNEDWPVDPKVIPVDYVTRAGYLLQKGGAYKNIGVGKPATWVPVNE